MASTELVPVVQQHGVIAQMAARYGLQPAMFQETIKKTVMPAGQSVSNEQLAAFLVVANQYTLNPFTKEIYAFPSKGGIVPIVSIDGWSRIINSQATLDGVEFEEAFDSEGRLFSSTCKIHRKDRKFPTLVTEYLSECKRQTEPWNKWPARMLRHKAFIQCARIAFSLSGIYDPDEAERIAETTDRAEMVKSATERKAEELKAKYAVKPESEKIADSEPQPTQDNAVTTEAEQVYEPERFQQPASEQAQPASATRAHSRGRGRNSQVETEPVTSGREEGN